MISKVSQSPLQFSFIDIVSDVYNKSNKMYKRYLFRKINASGNVCGWLNLKKFNV